MSGPVSRPSRIRLATIPKTRNHDADETSSTHQLADADASLPRPFHLETGREGAQVAITSETNAHPKRRESNMPKIYVRNDVMVEVDDTRRGSPSR